MAIYCLQKYFQNNKTVWKQRGGKNILSEGKQSRATVLGLIPEKVAFKVKSTEEDTEGHYTKIKGTIYEEDIKVIKLHAPRR